MPGLRTRGGDEGAGVRNQHLAPIEHPPVQQGVAGERHGLRHDRRRYEGRAGVPQRSGVARQPAKGGSRPNTPAVSATSSTPWTIHRVTGRLPFFLLRRLPAGRPR